MKYKIIILVSAIILVIVSLFLIIYITPVQGYGYWKPGNTETYVREVAAALPQELKLPEVITSKDQNNVTYNYIRSVSENQISNNTISEKELTQISNSLAEDITSKIGSGDIELKNIEPPGKYNNYYKFVYNRKGIQFCLESSIVVWIRKDGSIDTISASLYPNLTAPTRPRISETQMKQLIIENQTKGVASWEAASKEEKEDYINHVMGVKGKLCIFPKWHPEEEYWTYHLSWNIGNLWLDSMNGEKLHEIEAAIVE